MLSMIISLRNNRELLKNKRNAFNKDRLNELPGKNIHPLKFKKVSEVKLLAIKQRIRSESARERRKGIIILVVLVVVMAVTFLIFTRRYLV